MLVPNNLTVYERDIRNLQIMEKRCQAAFKRLGLTPFETLIKMVTDDQMNQNLVYVAIPFHYHHWRYGKYAQQGHTGHVFEVVINADPSYCYHSTTNDLPMQFLVYAHACGGHVDFFANNFLFAETSPQDVLQRFKANEDFVESLVEDPDWGEERIDEYLDAAHAIELHIGWLPTLEAEKNKEEEDELRTRLVEELRELRAELSTKNVTADRTNLEHDIADLENRLKCHPINPTGDLLGFLIDPANTPNLPDKARQLLHIVREQGRYFQPQGRTKFMNEGWATFWEHRALIQPEVDLPTNMELLPLNKYWAMFDRYPLNWYLDPYALGEGVWLWIDKKYGFDEEEVTVPYLPLDYNEETGELVEGTEWKETTVTQRNWDKMFEVRESYDDYRFLEEFLSKEFLEHINLKILTWLRGSKNQIGLMELINSRLKKLGWQAPAVFETLPETLEGLIEVVQTWTNIAFYSQFWGAWFGYPPFPIHMRTLQLFTTALQIIAAFDEDWHKLKKQLVLRTGYNSVPVINLLDTGRYADGVWTLKHEYDYHFGPLVQSEARETLRYFRGLCGSPVRLLTMEQRLDYWGNPYGDPVPYEYFCKDGITVKERFLA